MPVLNSLFSKTFFLISSSHQNVCFLLIFPYIDAKINRHMLIQEKYSFENEKIAIKGFMVGSGSVWLPDYTQKDQRPHPLCFMRYGGREVPKSNISLFSQKQHIFSKKYHQNKNILRKIFYKNGLIFLYSYCDEVIEFQSCGERKNMVYTCPACTLYINTQMSDIVTIFLFPFFQPANPSLTLWH